MNRKDKIQLLKDFEAGKVTSIKEALRIEQPLFSDTTETGLWSDLDKKAREENSKINKSAI